MSKSSRTYDLVIAAGETAFLNTTGEFYYILECNLSSFLIAEDGGSSDFAKLRTYRRQADGATFENLRFENPNGSSLILKVVAGFGQYSDDEVYVAGNISNSQVAGTDLVIGAGATGSIAANANRRECFIGASGTLRLSDTTGKGYSWDGSGMFISSNGVIDFFNDTATNITVQFTEFET